MSKERLVISGASGVVGRHLIAAAKDRYDITILTRKITGDEPAGVKAVRWNPTAAKTKSSADILAVAQELEGAYAIINLAGASIGDGRLDSAHKKRVLESRVDSTNTLTAALEQCNTLPKVWFQASAVGYYGDRGDEVLTEESAGQSGFFLHEVVQAWEAAAQPASILMRHVVGRLGLVLAQDADAWQRFLMPIKLFVGGRLGSGKQWYPWIDADDVAEAILYLIETPDARGVYNLVSPNPVRQIELTEAAAKRLGRPAIAPVPPFALRVVLGEVADMLLLPSAKALPKRLEAEGYTFRTPKLSEMMRKLL
jgi:uncharacterized protein